ncbi:MAG: AMP-dependent synthetase/ligase, partial [Pyrinomonadaceae bacterium]
LVEYCFTALRSWDKTDVVSHKFENQWQHLTSEIFIKRVRAVSLALIGLGIKKGDRIALLSENRPEWSIVDFAILSLGAINVPIYTTQAPEQVNFILQDSVSSILFVSNHRLFKHAQIDQNTLPSLRKIIFFDQKDDMEERKLSFSDFEQDGADRDSHYPQVYDLRLRETIGEDLATIIYTSGTTGNPKGVMLSHNNFIANVNSICRTLPFLQSDSALSVLPLSHIFERTAFYVFCCAGVSVYYCASFDQVGELMAEVKPTTMTAVPRLFEKVYHRIVKKTLSAGTLKRKLGLWAIDVGQKTASLENNSQNVPALLMLKHKIADTLVFSKWRQAIGGRLRFFISGGAPLSPNLSHAFL